MQDLGMMLASHTQQLLSQDTYVKIVGRSEERLREIISPSNADRLQVTPLDILVSYDVIAHDGSVPGGNFSGSWVELFKILLSSPALQGQFNLPAIFKYIAFNLGAKNVTDFVVRPDEQVQQQAQAGNLAPVPTQPPTPQMGM